MAPSAADTLSPAAGEPLVLYRVHKMRRRDRRGAPWILWWEEPAGGGRCRTATIGRMSERLAERHRELWQAELNGLAAPAEPGNVAWRVFREQFLDSIGADLEASTVAIYRQVLARFERIVRPRLLGAIDRLTVDRFRVERLREVDHETVRKDFRHLKGAFGWAVRHDLLAANPCDRVRVGRRERRDPEALSEKETRRFLDILEAEPTWIWAALRLACLWGPRAGELARLLREDLDLAGRTLRIPAKAGRRTPKGGRGRVVPLDEETAGLLQELSHRSGPVLWGPSDGAFGSERALREALGERARVLLEAVGAGRPKHPLQHLRRTAETNMRRRGVPAHMIARIIGHGTRVGDEWYDGVGPEESARQVAHLMRDWVTRGSPEAPPAGPEKPGNDA